MKRIIALILALTMLLPLYACKKKTEYSPVESTDEEARTVMTLSMDGKEYNVKYELYRAFFLTYKSEVDGGNAEVWTGDSKEVYIDRINSMILERITEIYAAFAMCEKIGFDLYSKDVENQIKEYVRISVEGGSYGQENVEGYESYEEYLAALKSMNLNYSVQTLLFRHAIATDAINTYYIGTASPNDVNYDMELGSIKYTKDDVRNFYLGDNCAVVLRGSFIKAISFTPEERAAALKETLDAAASSASTLEAKETAVFNKMMGENLYTDDLIIGKYDNYNPTKTYYGELADSKTVEAAFGISEGEVSDPMDALVESKEAYSILYKTYKSDEYFEENYENIRYVYLTNRVGEITCEIASSLQSSVLYSELLDELNYSEIGM